MVELGLTEAQAKIEASRCLKCNLTIDVETKDCILLRQMHHGMPDGSAEGGGCAR